MPREHRKRGKRKKNETEAEVEPIITQDTATKETKTGQPSWIEAAIPTETIFNPEAPFGFCEPDVKAYFRTVDKQLLEWQELGIENDGQAVEDPNLGISKSL